MKNIYLVAAIAAFSLAFSACSNDNNDEQSSSSHESSSSEDISSSSVTSTTPSSSSNSGSSLPSSGSNSENGLSSSSITSTTPSSSSNSGSSFPSSGSNSENGACYMNMDDVPGLFSFSACAEGVAEPITSSECEEMGAEEGWTVTFQSSCPSEYALKCEQEGINIYFYGMVITMLGMTCDDLLEEEEL